MNIGLMMLFALSANAENMFVAGKNWTYKVFFISPQKDTTDTLTAKLEILKDSTDEDRLSAVWKYNDISSPTMTFIKDDDYVSKVDYTIGIGAPEKGKFQILNLCIPAYYIKSYYTVSSIFKKPQDSVFTDSSGKSVVRREMRNWRVETSDFRRNRLTAEYVLSAGRKDVNTLMQEFKECLEIKGRSEIKTREEKPQVSDTAGLTAVFYFHDEFGFVRWEYTKPDSCLSGRQGSQVVFELEKMDKK